MDTARARARATFYPPSALQLATGTPPEYVAVLVLPLRETLNTSVHAPPLVSTVTLTPESVVTGHPHWDPSATPFPAFAT